MNAIEADVGVDKRRQGWKDEGPAAGQGLDDDEGRTLAEAGAEQADVARGNRLRQCHRVKKTVVLNMVAKTDADKLLVIRAEIMELHGVQGPPGPIPG